MKVKNVFTFVMSVVATEVGELTSVCAVMEEEGKKRKKLIQPTLFGTAAVTTGFKSAKTKDRSEYHKFMDAFCRRNGYRYSSREELFHAGQDVWRKEFRDSVTVAEDVGKFCKEVDKWCAGVPCAEAWCVPIDSQRVDSVADDDADDEDVICISVLDSVSTQSNASVTMDSNVPAPVLQLLKSLDLDAAIVLREDLQENADLMQSLVAFAPLANEFLSLQKSYVENSKFHKKKTKLADCIAECQDVLNKMSAFLEDISKIGTGGPPAAITHQATMDMQVKLSKVTDLFKHLTASQVAMQTAIRNLRRRTSGLRHDNLRPENVRLIIGVDLSLTWNAACAGAEELCCGDQSPGLRLSGHELLRCFAVIIEDRAMTVVQLFRTAKESEAKVSSAAGQKSCIQQLVRSAPLLLISCGQQQVLVDVHSLSLRSHGGVLAELLCLCDEPDEEEENRSGGVSTYSCGDFDDGMNATDAELDFADEKATHRGRPRKHEEFPGIVQETLLYLEQHGCEAQGRRRTDTANCLGVTLKDLQRHLLASVPGLREKGISRTAIHELMMPPRQRTLNAARYKQLVNSRVPQKQNSRAVTAHKDFHFCAAQVNMVMEFTAKYPQVGLILADDMNKVNIGGPAVSRYHQLRRFFVCGDSPNLPDHDLPVTGMNKITPSGYMVIQDQGRVAHRRSSSAPPSRCQFSPCSQRARSCSPVRTLPMPKQLMVEDKLGRLHYQTSRTGPVHIFCRSAKFNGSSSTKHCSDLKYIAEALQPDVSVIAVVVDGGPDWSFKSVSNILAMGRCWQDCKLDGLLLTSYAPGQSKYNPIERQWAPRSRDLSGVELTTCLPTERQPPSAQTGLSEEERVAKERTVHDNAIKEVCSYWVGKMYDGHPVMPHPVICPIGDDVANEEEALRKTAGLSARKASQPEAREAVKELQFLLRHCNRSRYLISFVKCSDDTCAHCSTHPVSATQAVEELRLFSGRVPSPRPSCLEQGHFATYMECLLQPAINPAEDSHLPSFNASTGRCQVQGCRYVFTSQADATRHRVLAHPGQKADCPVPNEPKQHECRAIVDGHVCSQKFSSPYYLRKHRQQTGHEVRRGRPNQS